MDGNTSYIIEEIHHTTDLMSALATGGISGLIVILVGMFFRFLESRHHLVSKCQKDGITVIADVSTPKNITNIIENATAPPPHASEQGSTDCGQPVGERRTGSVGVTHTVSVPGGEEGQDTDEGQDRSQPAHRRSSVATRENPGSQPLPDTVGKQYTLP